jgi:hypothetical protein
MRTEAIAQRSQETPEVFRSETLIKGQPTLAEYIRIGGQSYSIERGPITMVRLQVEDEWYEDIQDPSHVIAALKTATDVKSDIFTFWQRVPDTNPKYNYYTEWESVAVLPIKTFDHWWSKQAKGTTRNMVRKSQKMGIEVREASFDDDFIRGMAEIFNESPVRQGRRFWHYGKDSETIKRQFSRYLFREDLIGAYYQNELAGFVILGNAGLLGVLGQFISMFKHRDKATNNALMAKTIEVCEKRNLAYLTYGDWNQTSLVDFKRHCGFEEMKVPRYYIPLSLKGKVALQLGLHRGLKHSISPKIVDLVKNLRRNWHGLRTG